MSQCSKVIRMSKWAVSSKMRCGTADAEITLPPPHPLPPLVGGPGLSKFPSVYDGNDNNNNHNNNNNMGY